MKYFTLDEFVRSPTAQRLGIDNTPPPEVVERLTALVDNVLDPLRERLGKPIIVTSGYRSPALNRAVGGATTSQHTRGEAVDFVVGGGSRSDLFVAMGIIRQSLPFDQLINEQDLSWLHLSYRRDGQNRRQFLSLPKGRK